MYEPEIPQLNSQQKTTATIPQLNIAEKSLGVYPFVAFVGQGLGLRFSSLDKVGLTTPMQPFGAAGLEAYVNCANGNLVLKGHTLKIVMEDDVLELGWIYNSQGPETPLMWQWMNKMIVQLPPPNQQGGVLTIQEIDGHWTNYLQTKEGSSSYIAAQCAQSQNFCFYDGDRKQWHLYDSATRVSEFFNPSDGTLQERRDERGRQTLYEYQNGILSAMTTFYNQRYELRWSGNNLFLYHANENTLLMQYFFDNLNRLTRSETAAGYQVNYTYVNQTGLLKSVSQSDQTAMQIGIDNNYQLNSLTIGNQGVFRFTYASSSQPNCGAVVQWVNGSVPVHTLLAYDKDFDLTELSYQLAIINALKTEITTYNYTAQKQLQTITYPNGGQKQLFYDSVHNYLLTKMQQPNGQVTEYFYTSDSFYIVPVSRVQYLDPKTPLVTYFVYGKGASNSLFNKFKCFEISPEGRVTEFRPGPRYSLGSKREYIGALFNTSAFPPNVGPVMVEMTVWVNQQNSSLVCLEEYVDSRFGLKEWTYHYAEVDQNGNGIKTLAMGEVQIYCNQFGSWMLKNVRVNEKTQAKSLQTVDSLQRTTQLIDPLNNETHTTYQDSAAEVIIQYPNGRKATLKHHSSNVLATQTMTANNILQQSQTRLTHIKYDTSILPVVTELPDGQALIQFFDLRQRLLFSVSPLGVVTQYTYDMQHGFAAKTIYATRIDVEKIYPDKNLLPGVGFLTAMLPSITHPKEDRTSYTFFDESGRKSIELDAMGAITQTVYNNLNREIAVIRYADFITEEELNALKAGQAFSRKPDFNQDRCKRTFYDKDNLSSGTQDEAGFITSLKRDNVKRVQEKILYATKVPIKLEVNDITTILPASSPKDAHTTYFYNGRKKPIAKINPENVYTAYTYYPTQKVKTKTVYATKVSPPHPNLLPQGEKGSLVPKPPTPSSEDQTTQYEYDLKNRLLKTTYSDNHEAILQYDDMGNCIFDGRQDTTTTDINGDTHRNTQTQFDGFEQKARTANPWVGELLVKNPNNATTIWQTQSLRTTYAPCGLKLAETDERGNTTYFYYNIDRQWVVTIAPQGIVIEHTLNAFGESILDRAYDYRINTQGLTGGFMTTAFENELKQLQNDEKDERTTFTRNYRGEVTQKVDAEGYPSVFEYNAFGEKTLENLAIDWKEIQYLFFKKQFNYDTRGYLIEHKRWSGQSNAVCRKQYVHDENPLGKCTLYLGPAGEKETHAYDCVGNRTQTTDAYGNLILQLDYDAFNRIKGRIDALKHLTEYVYDQKTRSCTLIFPITTVTLTKIFNVFNEVIQTEDSLKNIHLWLYAPDGQITQIKNPLQATHKNKYDLKGLHTVHLDPLNVLTLKQYNPNDWLAVKQFDPQGLNHETGVAHDSFGNDIEIGQMPSRIITKKQFDKRNLNTQTAFDVRHLNRITTKVYNGQRTLCNQQIGTQTDLAACREEKLSLDGLDRIGARVLDPQWSTSCTPIFEAIMRDAGGKIIRTHDPITKSYVYSFYDLNDNLCIKIDAMGHVTQFSYNTARYEICQRQYANPPVFTPVIIHDSLSQIEQMLKSSVDDKVTWSFYDNNNNLRFIVNNDGGVIEHRYDEANRKIQTIAYSKAITANFDTLTTTALENLMAQNQTPTDSKQYFVLDGAGQQRFIMDREGFVIGQNFDLKGRLINKTIYAHPVVLPSEIAQLPWEQVLSHLTLDPARDQTTAKTYDSIDRVLTETNALGQTTSYAYNDELLTTTTTYPNGNVVVTKTNAEKKVISQSETATINGKPQTRNTTTIWSDDNRTEVTTHPDGRKTVTIFDALYREAYTISAEGIVKFTEYTHATGVKQVIKYANRIDVTKLPQLPTASHIQELLNPSPQDRSTYQRHDLNQQNRYRVDGNDYVTSMRYDALGRLTHKIQYATKLTLVQLQTFLKGEPLDLPFDFKQDRLTSIFYDTEGHKIGSQDGAGYVTEFKRDGQGHLIEKIRYATPTTVKAPSPLEGEGWGEGEWAQVKPIPIPTEDARTLYVRDSRGLCICKVDPEGYATEKFYNAAGFVIEAIQYENKVPESWLNNPVGLPDVTTSSNDRTTKTTYDQLNRPTQINLPFNTQRTLKYDLMGHTVFDETLDLNQPTSNSGDHVRRTESQYDNFGQQTHLANPYVGQLLVAIDNNTNLTPEEKKEAKEKVWATQSTRNTFDDTGLLVQTTDPLGFVTIHYTNKDRLPVLSISPDGHITENTLSSFDQSTQTRRYATQLTQNQRATLKGGLLTPELQQFFIQLRSPADEINKTAFDNRGQVEVATDGEGFYTTHSYNAFRELETEIKPVASQDNTMTISHRYEQRGLETIRTESSLAPGGRGGISISTTKAYQNLYGKETAITDGDGNTFTTTYTQRGQIATQTDALEKTISTRTHDAFGRIKTNMDALENTTTHSYNDSARTETIQTPMTGVLQTLTHNIFDETVHTENGLGDNSFQAHEPDGQIRSMTNALKESTLDSHNLLGQKTSHSDAAEVETSYAYNGEGQLTQTIEDVGGLHLTTIITRDPFGNAESEQDPRGIITKNTFDKRNLKQTSVRDPGGLNLTTTIDYNAAGIQQLLSEGDNENLNQYQKLTLIDGLNRKTGEMVDPNGLKITTEQQLNPEGEVIVSVDPNGNITRQFYNKNGKLLFKVDPEGGVVGWTYDDKGRKITEQYYDKAINTQLLNENSTLIELEKLLAPSKQDGCLTYLYDANDNERFALNSLGAVVEKRYDLANRPVLVIRYATKVDPQLIPSFTTETLSQFMAQHLSKDDRKVYRLPDSINQVRFTIDAENYIIENQYDVRGNLLASTQYATLVNNPAYLATLPIDEVANYITKNSAEDRVTYRLYDDLNRPIFVVNSEGEVTQFFHDKDDNLVLTCDYKAKIEVPQAYQTIVALLTQWKPNYKVDRLTTSQFDKANRKWLETDPLGFEDQFKRNAVGEMAAHLDRNKELWQNKFDGAKRLTQELTPEVQVVQVTATPTEKKHTVHLTRAALVPQKAQNVRELLLEQLPVDFVLGLALPELQDSVYDSCAQYINQMLGKCQLTGAQLFELVKVKIETEKDAEQALQALTSALKIQIHLVVVEERPYRENQTLLNSYHRLIDKKGARTVDEEDPKALNYNKPKLLHLVLYQNRVAPLVPKAKCNAKVLPVTTTTVPYVTLETNTVNISIVTEHQYDHAGNETALIHAQGTPEARTITYRYDGCNRKIGSQEENVPIDNPNLPGSYTVRPEQLVTLTTAVVYNAKGKPMVTRNESGTYTFDVYDSEGRSCYQINERGAVLAITRNTFGEVMSETYFAELIHLNLNDYVKTGIPLAVMQQQGVIQTSKEDRTLSYGRDLRGKVTLKQTGPVFYYLPNGSNPTYGFTIAQRRATYNAFGEKTSHATLINPKQNGEKWSYRLSWYNRIGKKIATCDEKGYVTIFTYGQAFCDVTVKQEWANGAKVMPTVDTTFAMLLTYYVPDVNQDRVYRTSYDLRGDKISETLKAESVQQLNVTQQNVPSVEDLPRQDVVHRYTYSPTQQKNSKTLPNGNTAYTFYTPIGKVGIKTEIPTSAPNQNEDWSLIIPLTYTSYNAHGDEVLVRKFALGAKGPISPSVLPQPVQPSADDQTTLTLRDIRGHIAYQQNPAGYVTGFTYTASSKDARKYLRVSNPHGVALDETRKTYDAKDNLIECTLWRNNQLQQTTAYAYSLFDENIAEGQSVNDLVVYRKRDQNGKIWSTNQDGGVASIYLSNLDTFTTVRLQSAKHNLSDKTEDDLQDLLDTQKYSLLEIERFETARDSSNFPIKKTYPTYSEPDPGIPNIPLALLSGTAFSAFGAVSLSWLAPQETHIAPVMSLIPLNGKVTTQLTPVLNNGRYGVDVSDLPCDVYSYTIDFFGINPLNQQPTDTILYQTTGVIPCVTKNREKSINPVFYVTGTSTLMITGHSFELTSLQLMQGKTQIADIALHREQETVDLIAYPSGTYTVIAMFKETALAESLPFNIYTAIPAPTPLAQTIETVYSLKYLEVDNGYYGQLLWQVPDNFKDNAVIMTCHYLDTSNQAQVWQDTIQPGTDKGQYKDQDGNILVCNTIFNGPVQTVTSVTLSLQLATQDVLCIVKQKVASSHTGNGTQIILDTLFPKARAIYATGFPNLLDPITLEYLDTSQDRLATWKKITTISVTTLGFSVDVSRFAPSCYPFRLNANAPSEVFSLSGGELIVMSNPASGPHPPKQQNPSTEFAFDRWRNRIKSRDTLNNETDYGYNKRNRCRTQLQPMVTVLNENGSTHQVRPLTQQAYNLSGYKIASINPNGHVDGFEVNEAGLLLAHLKADGTVMIANRCVDGFGRFSLTRNSRWLETWQVFDHMNNVIRRLLASGQNEYWGFNEYNRMSSQTDVAGEVTYYDVDVNQFVSQSTIPGGETILYQNNHLGQCIFQNNYSYQTSLYWSRDYFGDMVTDGDGHGHIDLGGANYLYEYDLKRQLVREFSTNNNHGMMLSFDITATSEGNVFSTTQIITPGKNVKYQYRNGLLVEAIDYANNTHSIYTYDTERRRVTVALYEGGSLVSLSNTQYDAIGRETQTQSAISTIVKAYDGASNIRRQLVVIIPPGLSPQNAIYADKWFTFDINERTLIDGGLLINDVIQITNSQGTQRSYGAPGLYGAGLMTNIIDLSNPVESGWVNSQLGYDNINMLISAVNPNNTSDNNLHGYDNANRPNYFTQALNGQTQKSNSTIFNANSWPLSNSNWKPGQTVNTSYQSWNQEGTPDYQLVNIVVPRLTATDHIHTQFVAFDRLLMSGMSGHRHANGQTSAIAYTSQYHDANGNLGGQGGVIDKSDDKKKHPKKRSIVLKNTHNGLALKRIEIPAVNPGETGDTMNETDFIYDIHGNVMCDYTKSVTEFNWSISFGDNYRGYQFNERSGQYISVNSHNVFAGDTTVSWKTKTVTQHGSRSVSVQHNTFHFGSRGFGIAGYRTTYTLHINHTDYLNRPSPSYPAQSSSIYVVKDGDTLQKIAQSELGNSQLAGAIGYANNITNSSLEVGLRLTIPQLFPNQVNAGSTIDYNAFINHFMDNLYPHLQTPQKKHHGSCFHNFIHAVVDVVVGVVAGLLSGGNPFVIAAAVAAADTAYQEVAVQLGWQPRINFKAALAAGVESAIAAKIPLGSAGSIFENAGRAFAIAFIDQTINIAMGLQTHMDIGALIAAASIASFASKIEPTAENITTKTLSSEDTVQMTEQLGTKFVNNLMTNTMDNMLTDLIDSRPITENQLVQDGSQAFAQVLGQAIGVMAGDELNKEFDFNPRLLATRRLPTKNVSQSMHNTWNNHQAAKEYHKTLYANKMNKANREPSTPSSHGSHELSSRGSQALTTPQRSGGGFFGNIVRGSEPEINKVPRWAKLNQESQQPHTPTWIQKNLEDAVDEMNEEYPLFSRASGNNNMVATSNNQHPPQRTSPSLLQSIGDSVKDGLQDVMTYVHPIVDKISDVFGDMSDDLSGFSAVAYKNGTILLRRAQTIESEGHLFSDGRLETSKGLRLLAKQYFDLSVESELYSWGATGLSGLGFAALGYEGYDAYEKVQEAPPQEKTMMEWKEYGGLGFGAAAGFATAERFGTIPGILAGFAVTTGWKGFIDYEYPEEDTPKKENNHTYNN